MRHRSVSVVAALGLLAGACTGGATTAPSTSPAASVAASQSPATSASASAAPSGSPSSNLPQSIGQGEGQLNIIIWAGYAEDGSNKKEYDWVHPFETKTGCKVNVKVGNTSDEMVSLMRQGGGSVYDGVSASGDATLRLIGAGDVAEINPALIPDWNDIAPFLQSPPHNMVNGKHYGVSHGWGGNSLMFRTDVVKPAPTSWNVVFDPTASKPYQGKITAYDSPIYIADAALYLKTQKPDLGIKDPYELTQDQFNAAVDLLKQQHPWVGKYWAAFGDEIDNFTSGATVVGTTWPYQVNTLKDAKVPVESVVPTEGMTGWADTWMMSSHAKHPNCMYEWMGWMVTPQVQAEVAESFGESPANPKACTLLDKGVGPYAVAKFCDVYHTNDPAYYNSISFWKTPTADCGGAGGTCVDYSTWTQSWTSIKSGT